MNVGWGECNETQRFSNVITSSQVHKYELFVVRSLGRQVNFTTETTEMYGLPSHRGVT